MVNVYIHGFNVMSVTVMKESMCGQFCSYSAVSVAVEVRSVLQLKCGQCCS